MGEGGFLTEQVNRRIEGITVSIMSWRERTDFVGVFFCIEFVSRSTIIFQDSGVPGYPAYYKSAMH